jgi:hypothetical protein
MTTLTGAHTTTTTGAVRRPSPAALVAAGLVGLTSAFGAYGSIYFTGLEGWDAFGITYVTIYVFVALTGFVAAVALARGQRLGLVGVTWYAAFNVVFTSMKLITIQEGSAIPFGLVALVVLGLVTRPSVRRYASR